MTKQLPIGFTERHREMIKEVMEHYGTYPSMASVVQRAVEEMHSKMVKEVKENKKDGK